MGWKRLVIATIAMSGSLSGWALASGEVGGPPSSNFDRCFRILRPCTDPVVLATGEHLLGPVEVIAFGSARGLCLGADTFERNGASGFFGCGGEGAPPGGKAIALTGVGGSSSPKGPDATQILGTVRSDVAAVRIRYRRKGASKLADQVFNQIDGPLAERIGEDSPFGVFETTVRGCVEPKRFRVAAYSSDGEVLERLHLVRSSGFCDVPLPSATNASRIWRGVGSSTSKVRSVPSRRSTFDH